MQTGVRGDARIALPNENKEREMPFTDGPAEGRRRHAFTLIELLIVVAIIAILAAIATPNFLEAQMRAKISRTRNDMRTVATALEAYAVDTNKYPPMRTHRVGMTRYIMLFVPDNLTTPVAYLSHKRMLVDPFKPPRINTPSQTGSTDDQFRNYYNYINIVQIDGLNITNFTPSPPVPRSGRAGGWELWSYGPDQVAGPEYRASDNTRIYIQYDATNGTVSDGDIRRTQKDTSGVMSGEQ